MLHKVVSRSSFGMIVLLSACAPDAVSDRPDPNGGGHRARPRLEVAIQSSLAHNEQAPEDIGARRIGQFDPATSPHAAEAVVTLQGSGRANERILVHAADGALTQELRTDQAGRVAFELPARGLVTWVRDGDQVQLRTIAVVPSDWVYRFEANDVPVYGANVPVAAHLVSPPASRVTLETNDGVRFGAQAPFGVIPIELSSLHMANMGYVQVLARLSEVGSDFTALATTRVDTQSGVPSDIAVGDWKSPTPRKVLLKGLPSWSNYIWHGSHLYRDGSSFEYEWADATLTPGTSELEVDSSSVDLGFSGESWEVGAADEHAAVWALVGPRPVDASVSVEGVLLPRALPPMLHDSNVRAREAVRWVTPEMPLVGRVTLTLESTAQRWQIWVPNDADTLIVPMLPADLCQNCMSRVSVEYLDTNVSDLFDALPPFADVSWYWHHARGRYRDEDFLRGSRAW